MAFGARFAVVAVPKLYAKRQDTAQNRSFWRPVGALSTELSTAFVEDEPRPAWFRSPVSYKLSTFHDVFDAGQEFDVALGIKKMSTTGIMDLLWRGLALVPGTFC